MITYIFDNLSISYVTCLPSAVGCDDYNPRAGIYLFKVNNANTSTLCEVCPKLTMKISERCP